MLVTTRILRACLSDLKCFRGVFAADKLPLDRITDKSLFVINTDNADEPGEHWVSLYVRADGTAVFFNSFGLPPLVPSVGQFIRAVAPRSLQYSNVCIQSATSTSCGLFCIAFCRFMAMGGDLSLFVSLFTHKAGNIMRANDVIVKEILIQELPLKHHRLLQLQL